MNRFTGNASQPEGQGDEIGLAETVGREEAGQWMRRAAALSVTTAFVLIVVKLIAWQLTDSLSLLASLIDSLLDAAASLVSYFAVRHALTPPDSEHRFGHGKAEPLAALGQAAFITGSAAFLVIEASHRLFHPQPVEHGTIGMAVMVFSIAATLGLVTFQRLVIRKTGSLAIKADHLHYAGDLLANLAVIAALLLASELGWLEADPLFGMGIAAYILYNAWLIARQSLDMLMDRELPDEDRARIKQIILQRSAVRGYHDLRTRASGPQTFIQCHLELDGDLNLLEAHDIANEVEKDLEAAFPGAEVILHQDPYPDAALPKPPRPDAKQHDKEQGPL